MDTKENLDVTTPNKMKVKLDCITVFVKASLSFYFLNSK